VIAVNSKFPGTQVLARVEIASHKGNQALVSAGDALIHASTRISVTSSSSSNSSS
jgi:hypothetical protein